MLNKAFLAQILRFGAVGGLATLTHVGVAIAAEAGLTLAPQLANLAGYLVAVVVSYTGHALVTFKAPVQSAGRFLRFILVSLLGLATSSGTVWLTTGVLGLAFPVAMLCVAVAVPMVTYLGMRFWVFDGRSEAAFAPGDVLVPVGLGLGVVAVFWDRLVNHDIAWYLFATRDWLAGAQLYVDLVEVNPPLAFYLTVPSLFIADATGLSDQNAHYVAVTLLLVASLLWCAMVLRQGFLFSAAQRALFLGIAGLAVLLPTTDGLGQREQFLVLCLLPWALREAAPRPATRGQMLTSAAFAAVGMCLKPHFVLLPLAVTLLNCWQARSLRPVFSLANLVFAGTGLAYVAYVANVHPAYLTQIVPLAMDVYGTYGKTFPQTLSIIALTLGIVQLWVVLTLREQRPGRPVAVFLTLAAGGLASYFLQSTGFNYHKVPFHSFSMMAAALALLSGTLARQAALYAAIVIFALGSFGYNRGFYGNWALPGVSRGLADQDKVNSLLTMSVHVYAGPGVAMAVGADWAGRYPHNWLVPGAVNGLGRADCTVEAERCARLRAAADRNRSAIVADVLREKPDMVIVDRHLRYFDDPSFDWLTFVAADPGWAEAFAPYRKVADTGRFAFFRRGE
jgi:putative flippase GtrA